jgi:hypothetical protein
MHLLETRLSPLDGSLGREHIIPSTVGSSNLMDMAMSPDAEREPSRSDGEPCPRPRGCLALGHTGRQGRPANRSRARKSIPEPRSATNEAILSELFGPIVANEVTPPQYFCHGLAPHGAACPKKITPEEESA